MGCSIWANFIATNPPVGLGSGNPPNWKPFSFPSKKWPRNCGKTFSWAGQHVVVVKFPMIPESGWFFSCAPIEHFGSRYWNGNLEGPQKLSNCKLDIAGCSVVCPRNLIARKIQMKQKKSSTRRMISRNGPEMSWVFPPLPGCQWHSFKMMMTNEPNKRFIYVYIGIPY